MNLESNRFSKGLVAAAIVAFCLPGSICHLSAQTSPAGGGDPRDDSSPWGMGSSAEWSGEYPRFDPLLEQAGVKWLRLWNEWQGTEPKRGQFDWGATDRILADAKRNHLHVFPTWAFFAPWASADGGTRRGPIKDIQFWREYVSASVERYHQDIKYWEVWNEFNGSFYEGENKPKAYADLVVAAYDAAKKADPTAKVGLSVANFDVGFLAAAIQAGAADHFDFLCVHPYENLRALADGGEMGFLSLTGNLREMLKANHQRTDVPLWITEVGYPVPVQPEAGDDAKQAAILVKGELLSLVQGFQRIFWFEARGPAYGKGTDLGIIRPDWSLRPSYQALEIMTKVLGPEPKYLGWLNVAQGAYGFVFQGATGNVLATWSPAGKDNKVKFDDNVNVTGLAGGQMNLAAGQEMALSTKPVFITGLPESLAALARSNATKPYPWGADYAHAQEVTCEMGAVNRENGLKQVNPNTTAVVNGLVESYARPNFSAGGEGRYIYFRVDPQFVPYGTTHLQVTIVARRMAADKEAGMNLTYESVSHGYTNANKWNNIPADDKLHELSWELTDANFVGQWGWNFRFDTNRSANEFYVKEVRVKRFANP